MDVKFVLDFDGVLFNSAYEAYSVAEKCTKGREGFRQDIEYEEFLEFRKVVTDAWQYNRLYSVTRYTQPAAVPMIKPIDEDWDFAKAFFAAREEIMADPEWPKVMPVYDFFLRLKPLLIENRDKFAILSTRNVKSIREALAFHDADLVPVFGQEDIRMHGSKLAVAQSQGWCEKGRYIVVYLDDMNSHLEPFEGQVHLPLHADWGYDDNTPGSLTANQVMTIFTSLLALTKEKHDEKA